MIYFFMRIQKKTRSIQIRIIITSTYEESKKSLLLLRKSNNCIYINRFEWFITVRDKIQHRILLVILYAVENIRRIKIYRIHIRMYIRTRTLYKMYSMENHKSIMNPVTNCKNPEASSIVFIAEKLVPSLVCQRNATNLLVRELHDFFH